MKSIIILLSNRITCIKLEKRQMGVFSFLKNLFNKSKEDGSPRTSIVKRSVTSASSVSKEKNSINNSSIASKSSITSPTTSTRQQTSSSGYSYKYREGRRYHADESVAYVLPNDHDGLYRILEFY